LRAPPQRKHAISLHDHRCDGHHEERTSHDPASDPDLAPSVKRATSRRENWRRCAGPSYASRAGQKPLPR
jgi:hypothetical protein